MVPIIQAEMKIALLSQMSRWTSVGTSWSFVAMDGCLIRIRHRQTGLLPLRDSANKSAGQVE